MVYRLAHVYVTVLSQHGWWRRYQRPPARTFRPITETSVLLGGLPAIAVYVVVLALGGSPITAGYMALTKEGRRKREGGSDAIHHL